MSLYDVLLPQSVTLPDPTFVHICQDDPKPIKTFKQSEEVRSKRRIRLRAWRKKRGY